jgi:ribosomal protein S18 acetylase RimI-like enzyme
MVPDGIDGLYRLRKKDIRRASEVLSRAFLDDPDIVKILPDLEVRRRKLKHFFGAFLRFGIIYGEVYSPSPELEGVSVWMPSRTKDITFWRSLRSGFMNLIFKIDGKAMKVFSEYGKQMDRETRKTIQGEHWFLFIIGVDPKHQKRGFGRSMIEPMLARIDKGRLPVMLDTNKKDNVPYYQGYGFEVKRTYRVLDNDHWGMVRALK